MNIINKLISKFTGRTENSKTYNLITFSKVLRERDPLFHETVLVLTNEKSVYPGLIQKKVKVGYARAVRIMEDLELAGIIPPQEITSRPVFSNNVSSYLADPKKYDQIRKDQVEAYLNHKEL